MSVTCRIADRVGRRAVALAGPQAGFTLLEILVVMAIIGLAAAMVVPALDRVVASVTHDSELQDVIDQLDQLGFRAYTSGVPIVLSDGAPDSLTAASIVLPRAWKLSIPQPIHFNSLGMCDGGRVIVTSPDQQTTDVRLSPPDCAVEKPGR